MADYNNIKKFEDYNYGEIIKEDELRSGYFKNDRLYYGINANKYHMDFCIDDIEISIGENSFEFTSYIDNHRFFINYYSWNRVTLTMYDHSIKKYNNLSFEEKHFIYRGNDDSEEICQTDIELFKNILSKYYELYNFKPDSNKEHNYINGDCSFSSSFDEGKYSANLESKDEFIKFNVNGNVTSFSSNFIDIIITNTDNSTTLKMMHKDLPYIFYYDTALDYVSFIFKDKIIKIDHNCNMLRYMNEKSDKTKLRSEVLVDYFIPKCNNLTIKDIKDKFNVGSRKMLELQVMLDSNNLEKKNKKETKVDVNVDVNDPEYKLSKLIGLEETKKQLIRLKKHIIKTNMEEKINLNVMFCGNPGTGKTTVARLYGEILYKNEILPNNTFIECSRVDLVAEHSGQTADKTREVLNKALGGVLFIDEAYSLTPRYEKDYSKEAITEIVQFLEEHKGQICVIFAGYTKEMDEFFKTNPGLVSRVPKKIIFEDYNKEDLSDILELMLENQEYTMEDSLKPIVIDFINNKRYKPNFANAREVRNTLEQIEIIQAYRTRNDISDRHLTKEDLDVFLKENTVTNKFERVEKCKLPNMQKLLSYHIYDIPNYTFDYQKEAVVYIEVKTINGEFFTGSGFLITPDGYAITCKHVIEDATIIRVRRRVRDKHNNWVDVYYNSKLAYEDKKVDFAVIKLENKNENKFPYLMLEHKSRNLTEESALNLAYPMSDVLDNMVITDCKFVSHMYYKNHIEYLCDLMTTYGASGSCIISNKTNKVIGILLGNIGDLYIRVLDIYTILKYLDFASRGENNEN